MAVKLELPFLSDDAGAAVHGLNGAPHNPSLPVRQYVFRSFLENWLEQALSDSLV